MGIKLAPAKSGDIGDVRIVQLTQRVGGAAPTAYALNQAQSVRALVRCGKHPVGVLAATVTDDVNGIIEVSLGDANGWLATAAPGNWSIEYEVTFVNGDVFTWPSDGYDTIEVTAGIA